MEKIIAVGSLMIIALVLLLNAIADSIAYITDIIGELLLMVCTPLIVLLALYGLYRAFIGYQVGRIDALERSLHLERLAIENQGLRLDLDVVRPVNNVLPVSRQLIASGELASASLKLLESNINAQRTHPNVPNSISYSVKNDNQESASPDENLAEIVSTVLDFGDLYKRGIFGHDEILLGYTDDGPLYATPHKLKSIVCGGLSGSGKSNTTRFLLAQYALMGWKLAIFDPHGNSEEGILPSLMPLASSFFMPPAVEFDDGMEMLRCVMLEGERRSKIEGSKQSDFEPLLFVIDEVSEFAVISTDEEREYAEKSLPIILKSFRKLNIFGFCISQFWSQSDTGKLGFMLRRAAQTSIIHRMPEDGAKIIERFADMKAIDNLPTGTCLLNNTDIKRAQLQIPLCEMHHIENALPTAAPTAATPPSTSEDCTAAPTAARQIEEQEIDSMPIVNEEHLIYTDAAQDLSPSQRIQIENALADGDSNGQIIAEVFQHPNKANDRKGRRYATMINGVRIEKGMDLPYSPARKSANRDA